MNFTIVHEQNEDVCIMRVSGYFSADTGKELAQKVEESLRNGRLKFVFDFADCTSVNSPGAAAVLDIVLRIHDDFRGRVFITSLRSLMQNLFEMVGIFPLAGSADKIEAALIELA
jgi:anti-anti-sigma factor